MDFLTDSDELVNEVVLSFDPEIHHGEEDDVAPDESLLLANIPGCSYQHDDFVSQEVNSKKSHKLQFRDSDVDTEWDEDVSLNDFSSDDSSSDCGVNKSFHNEIYEQFHWAQERARLISNGQKVNEEQKIKLEHLLEQLAPFVKKRILWSIRLQIEKQTKKGHALSFTLEEKLKSLLMMRLKPKVYKSVKHIFKDTSEHSLTTHIERLYVDNGLHRYLLNDFKTILSSMNDLGKRGILIWHQMDITPGLCYDKVHDRVVGFANHGEGSKNVIADSVLVFMVVGLTIKWKQVICYNFTNGIQESELLSLITNCVTAVKVCGVDLIATVCDERPVNIAVMNTYSDELLADGIVHLYDPPSLLKNTRNDLMENDIEFGEEGERYVASWRDVRYYYNQVKGLRTLDGKKYLFRDNYVEPRKIQMNRVRSAARLFSNNNCFVMHLLRDKVDAPVIKGTQIFIGRIHMLFDSFNGFGWTQAEYRPLRRAVDLRSTHLTFWDTQVPFVKSVKFCASKQRPGTMVNWESNLERAQILVANLFQRGVTSIDMRTFNIDLLENFFERIKNHCDRRKPPTAQQFEFSFKSLLSSNFAGGHSRLANCEDDGAEMFLRRTWFVRDYKK